MADALIGHTGFVGGNLTAQRTFDCYFNSRNFHEMTGQRFDDLVCAAVSAVKWMANKEPEQDQARIQALQEVLKTTDARRAVLISTIDVYPVLSGADESFDCHQEPNHAYGTHRLAFEDFFRDHFPRCYVVRLPGLFGPGLKKNVIYDLLHDNCLGAINPSCSLQYYDLAGLWASVERQLDIGLPLLNLFTEPIPTRTILDRFFPDKQVGGNAGPEVHYDLRTRHGALFGQEGPYIASAGEVLEQLASFVTTQRETAR